MAETFSTDLPDIQGFIKELDLLDENVNNAVLNAMHTSADIIVNEQKRLVANSYLRLTKYITKGMLKVSKKGNITIDCGYQAETFETYEDNTNMGVYGVSVEFGRPGTGRRSGKTMKQTRYGKEIDVNKGTIQPQSHIIRGFENKAEEAANAVINNVSQEIDRFGDG